MPNTMTLISTVTVGAGGATSIDFSSIPGTYTDLQLVISARTSATGNIVDAVIFNSDSASNYSFSFLQGTGGAASSGNSTGTTSIQIGYVNDAGTTSNTFANQVIYIPNYTASTSKSMSIDTVQENNGTQALSWINAARWSGTAAITSLSVLLSSGNFVQYSTASLYGILKGSGGATVS